MKCQSLILDNCSRVACHDISFVLFASCWSSRWFFYPRWAPLDQISSEDLRRRNCADARSCRKSNSFITTKCLSRRWRSQIPPRCLVHCRKCDLHLNILYYTIQRICTNSTSIYIIFIWRIYIYNRLNRMQSRYTVTPASLVSFLIKLFFNVCFNPYQASSSQWEMVLECSRQGRYTWWMKTSNLGWKLPAVWWRTATHCPDMGPS